MRSPYTHTVLRGQTSGAWRTKPRAMWPPRPKHKEKMIHSLIILDFL